MVDDFTKQKSEVVFKMHFKPFSNHDFLIFSIKEIIFHGIILLPEYGAIFVYRHEMEKKDFEESKEKSSETDIKASASLMSQYAQASFSAGLNQEQSNSEKVVGMRSKVTTYTISKVHYINIFKSDRISGFLLLLEVVKL